MDADRILALARRCGAIVTLEEHVGRGGFGAAVLELLAERGVTVPVRCLAIPDRIIEHGDSDAIKGELGLDPAGISAALRDLIGR